MPIRPTVAALPSRTAARLRSLADMGLAAALLAVAAPPAVALDGCLVLLCLAAPSWGAIPQCVPPIRQLLIDLALGRAFPTCGMSGPGNSASHRWAEAPAYCPPQYVIVLEGESVSYQCKYTGAVSVVIDGQPWARTWWSMTGATVTEFTPAAKATMGSWDTSFDDDYAAWLATQPPAPPERPPDCDSGCGA